MLQASYFASADKVLPVFEEVVDAMFGNEPSPEIMELFTSNMHFCDFFKEIDFALLGLKKSTVAPGKESKSLKERVENIILEKRKTSFRCKKEKKSTFCLNITAKCIRYAMIEPL